MNTDLEELLTIKQVATIMNVTPQTLRRWDKSGLLKAVRVGVRRGIGDRRYVKSDVRDYISTIKTKSNS